MDSDGNGACLSEKVRWKDWINGSSNDWIKKFHTTGKNKAGGYTVYVQQEGSSKIFRKSITTVRNKRNLSVK